MLMLLKQSCLFLNKVKFWNQKCFQSSTSVQIRKPKNLGIIMKKDVCDALRKSKPVVALESTIITHGMPYPSNLQ